MANLPIRQLKNKYLIIGKAGENRFKEFSSGKATIIYNGQVISKKLDEKILMPRSEQELSYAYEDGGLKRIFIYGLKLGDTVKISIPSYPDVTLKAVNGNPFDPYTLREAK